MRRLIMVALLMAGLGGPAPQPASAGGAASPALGDAKALYALQRFAQARAAFRALAEAGEAEAAFRLALMLEAGQGGPADPEAALRWLVKAAQAGFAPACEMLAHRRGGREDAAVVCAAGAGGDDPVLAEAEAGDVRAMLLVARAKAAGEDGPPDLEAAVAWLRRAGAAGDAAVRAYVAAALQRICAQPAAPPSCGSDTPEARDEVTAPGAGADAGR
ncbi:MAG: hypothetical protein KatS3mg119_2049 [Rhodothalassiaceae bacterium]|nr:MAG: hypothetical protein KatS3mg119_2049 [Rhodothalassiaceae bacterium]